MWEIFAILKENAVKMQKKKLGTNETFFGGFETMRKRAICAQIFQLPFKKNSRSEGEGCNVRMRRMHAMHTR